MTCAAAVAAVAKARHRVPHIPKTGDHKLPFLVRCFDFMGFPPKELCKAGADWSVCFSRAGLVNDRLIIGYLFDVV